ncbi:hypothetical protein [Prosthecochloris sp. GSB1]|uniref:hypothetical protein n=1 Tax=Prosthecochloris sp. GSB1 TaxID=281093 RepID=UPI00129482BD|nr:hypothetical protein [Prosthecochloris sp. GSB1]
MPYSIDRHHQDLFIHCRTVSPRLSRLSRLHPRLIMPDAERLSHWTRIGDPVTVL